MSAERIEVLLTRLLVPLKRWAAMSSAKPRHAELLEMIRIAEEARQEALALNGKPDRRHIPAHVRQLVFARAHYICERCGQSIGHDGRDGQVDHIIPVARYGTNQPDNLQALCGECNREKAAT